MTEKELGRWLKKLLKRRIKLSDEMRENIKTLEQVWPLVSLSQREKIVYEVTEAYYNCAEDGLHDVVSGITC